MKNQADYSVVRGADIKSDLDRENDRLRKLDICVGKIVVPYKGNEVWIGLKGKKLIGQAVAHDYAKKLSKLMERSIMGAKSCQV